MNQKKTDREQPNDDFLSTEEEYTKCQGTVAHGTFLLFHDNSIEKKIVFLDSIQQQ